MAPTDWVTGDRSGLPIPATGTALRARAETFLTEVFHASGVLPTHNRVAGITCFDEWPGGSTGRKLLLSVAYERPESGLHSDLFVKFSRDLSDPLRDRARWQMESEVRFALLSRVAGFPIAVPTCLFADYHRDSGTGILITQRVHFGTGAVEPHYGKCLDCEMPEPLEHYEALTRALARLAGTHRAGGLGEGLAEQFPFDEKQFSVGDRAPYTARQLASRVSRFAEFAATCPQLLPKNIRSAAFIAQLAREVVQFAHAEPAVRQFLRSQPDLIALCHWNANVDNAWFWRNPRSELECGLMDWGNAGRMNVAMALWGAFSAAEIELWDRHLDGLLALFVTEYRRSGGPDLEPQELKLHLHLYVAIMGLAWLMDTPALIQAAVPDVRWMQTRFDPGLRRNEAARVRLHMMITFLHLWQTQKFGTLIDRMKSRRPQTP